MNIICVKDRASLAKNILLSLDQDEEEDSEDLWVEEARIRSDKHKNQNTKGKPAFQVMDELRAKYQ